MPSRRRAPRSPRSTGSDPIVAAQLIGYAGDVRRFANRDAFASYNGTAPVEFASGGRVVHRVSQRGNRRLNHGLHMVAVTQIRNPVTEGRIYFERKVAEGKTKKEALRSLKRQISNAVYRQLLLDAAIGGPGGHSGTTRCLRDRLFTLRDRFFGEVTPEPIEPYAVVPFNDGSIRRAWKSPELGS